MVCESAECVKLWYNPRPPPKKRVATLSYYQTARRAPAVVGGGVKALVVRIAIVLAGSGVPLALIARLEGRRNPPGLPSVCAQQNRSRQTAGWNPSSSASPAALFDELGPSQASCSGCCTHNPGHVFDPWFASRRFLPHSNRQVQFGPEFEEQAPPTPPPNPQVFDKMGRCAWAHTALQISLLCTSHNTRTLPDQRRARDVFECTTAARRPLPPSHTPALHLPGGKQGGRPRCRRAEARGWGQDAAAVRIGRKSSAEVLGGCRRGGTVEVLLEEDLRGGGGDDERDQREEREGEGGATHVGCSPWGHVRGKRIFCQPGDVGVT